MVRPRQEDLCDLVQPGKIHERKPTGSEQKPDGRWRCYDHEELLKRDKLSLDLFWIKDRSLTDTDSLPAPDGDLLRFAAGLFEALHRLDAANLDRIVAQPVSETGIGQAVMDRLRRAERGSGEVGHVRGSGQVKGARPAR